MIYPSSLEELILYFKKLPGVGEKSAERLALSFINFKKEDAESFSKAMVSAHQRLGKCSICSHLTDQEVCNICGDNFREKNVICVVEDYKSVFTFEKVGKFTGVYHVLDGLISPIDGINPSDINIDALLDRCKKLDGNIELIIALKASVEGEATTMYINKMLEGENIKITRLSYGIPIGAEMDYLDTLTLERALKDRQTIS